LTVVGNVHYNYRNGLLAMQYVFLIRSSAGGKKYVTRLSRVKYFLPPVRERIRNTYCMAKKLSIFIANLHAIFNDILRKKHGTLHLLRITTVSESVDGAYSELQSDRWDRLRLIHFHFEWFSVILRLNAHELLAFVYIFVECTLPRQSPVANQVLHQRQCKLIDVIERDVKIFLTTFQNITNGWR